MLDPHNDGRATRSVLTGVALIAILHCLVWFSIYNQTALGESPALDNRQTLELARAMSDGTLLKEPFHRAPLYPYILSLFLSAGIPFELLPLLARCLNAVALATMAGSTALLAIRIWSKPICGWIAGLLIALNPVLVFFAGDAFDILLASATLSVGLVYFQVWLKAPSLKCTFAIGFLLAIGAALRSHLLPLALLWPIIALILAKERRLLHAAIPSGLLAMSFLLLGLANLSVSGEFRVTPWQGAYSLWAGNSPEATGRIYSQKIRVNQSHRYDNPAKLESITLFEMETGAKPPHSIDEINAYWKQKTVDHITAHPMQWLGLIGRKAYYYLNSYEQYDNKTYSFHKRRHALLNWNPIHWGLLLIPAVLGVLSGLQRQHTRPYIIGLICIFAVYAAGVIIFYTSNRFRIPMLPILAALSAGSYQTLNAWKCANLRWRTLLVTCVLITLGITYSGFFNARETNTWEEDYALLANAALRTNRDQQAIHNARSALKMNPRRADMHAVLAQAHFNQWALMDMPQSINPAKAERLRQLSAEGAKNDSGLRALVGIYDWKLGSNKTALKTWEDMSDNDALALCCLIFVGHAPPPKPEKLKNYLGHPSYPMLRALVDTNPQGPVRESVTRFFNALLKAVETEDE